MQRQETVGDKIVIEDRFFNRLDMRSNPELLPEGTLADSVNQRLDRGTARDRGGFLAKNWMYHTHNGVGFQTSNISASSSLSGTSRSMLGIDVAESVILSHNTSADAQLYSYDSRGNMTLVDSDTTLSGTITLSANDPTNNVFFLADNAPSLQSYAYSSSAIAAVQDLAIAADSIFVNTTDRVLIVCEGNTVNAIKTFTYTTGGALTAADTASVAGMHHYDYNESTGILLVSTDNIITSYSIASDGTITSADTSTHSIGGDNYCGFFPGANFIYAQGVGSGTVYYASISSDGTIGTFSTTSINPSIQLRADYGVRDDNSGVTFIYSSSSGNEDLYALEFSGSAITATQYNKTYTEYRSGIVLDPGRRLIIFPRAFSAYEYRYRDGYFNPIPGIFDTIGYSRTGFLDSYMCASTSGFYRVIPGNHIESYGIGDLAANDNDTYMVQAKNDVICFRGFDQDPLVWTPSDSNFLVAGGGTETVDGTGVISNGTSASGVFVFGTGTSFDEELSVGTQITANGTTVTITSIISATQMIIDGRFSSDTDQYTFTYNRPASSIPRGKFPKYHQSRVWVAKAGGILAASDVLNYNVFNVSNEFPINQGGFGEITGVEVLNNNSIVVFKKDSIYLLSNISGSLNDVVLQQISRGVGCLAHKTIINTGQDILFLSNEGVFSINQVLDTRFESRARSLTYDVLPLVKRINRNYIGLSCALFRDDRYYISVPIDTAVEPTHTIIIKRNGDRWDVESYDIYSNEAFYPCNFFADSAGSGVSFLSFTRDGYAVDQGERDAASGDQINTTTYEYTRRKKTRGYSYNGVNRYYASYVSVNVAYQDPSFSLTANGDGVAETYTLATNETKSRTEYRISGQADWSADNANDDFLTPFRGDYTVKLGSGLQLQSGVALGLMQETEEHYALKRESRYFQIEIENTQGLLELKTCSISGIDRRNNRRGKIR